LYSTCFSTIEKLLVLVMDPLKIYVHVFQDIMAGEAVNVKEIQELAREALPKMHYDFYAGGAEDEYTLKENVKAFSRIT
jgi:(S)-2-hydroxy-acid oxidase